MIKFSFVKMILLIATKQRVKKLLEFAFTG